jgi:hypothetical protein
MTDVWCLGHVQAIMVTHVCGFKHDMTHHDPGVIMVRWV